MTRISRALAVSGALSAFLSALTTASVVRAQTAPASSQVAPRPLPVDRAVRTGTLPNGMKYYIRRNTEPKNRAELRLVVNAGSILETDEQRGYAHLLEHMAFDGTKHFPKHKLTDYLQSIGMGFGADINALTSFDETIYQLTIPTDSAGFVAAGLQVLQDWASNVALDSTEVERERNVVVEEWRTRRGVGTRVSEQQFPVTFANSKYADRLPIGLVEVLQSATASKLRRFYDDWYRPDLMAVIVVGDIDDAEMEKMVKAQFSGLTARITNPPPRPNIEIPARNDTQFAIISDPELTAASVSLMYRRPETPVTTTEDIRRAMVWNMYNGMLSQRLAEIARKPDAPFYGAGSMIGSLNRTRSIYQLAASPKEGQIETTIQTILTEIARLKQFGFEHAEFDRQRTALRQAYDNALQQKDKIASAAFVDAYVENFLRGTTIVSADSSIAIAKALLTSISLADVNQAVTKLVTESDRAIVVSSPKKDGLRIPDTKTLTAAYDAGIRATVTKYVDAGAGDEPLIAHLPKAGKVVSEVRDSTTGTVDWKLSNGIRVVIKQTDFTPDAVTIVGTRPGGASLAPDSMFVPAIFAGRLIPASGLAKWDIPALQKKLNGKTAAIGTSIETYSESASASATPADLETALQLLYLAFTAPRQDSTIFRRTIDGTRAALLNRNANPDAAFGDTIAVTMSQHHPKAPLMSEALLQKMDLGKSFAFYKQRFADAGEFTFVIVGVMSPEALKPLVERYLGALPTTSIKHAFADLNINPPTGVVRRIVYRGTEPKSVSQILFTGKTEDTRENRIQLNALQGILDLRILETLRQKLGGTYTPQVNATLSRIPHPSYSVGIAFGCDPARLEELQQAVLADIEALKKNGPSETDLQKVKEESRRKHESALRDNQFWSNALLGYATTGRKFADILTDNGYIQKLTTADIREAAKKFLKSDNYAMFSMVPEAAAPKKMAEAGTR